MNIAKIVALGYLIFLETLLSTKFCELKVTRYLESSRVDRPPTGHEELIIHYSDFICLREPIAEILNNQSIFIGL